MGLFDGFPFTNTHQLNLDWILSKVKESNTLAKSSAEAAQASAAAAQASAAAAQASANSANEALNNARTAADDADNAERSARDASDNAEYLARTFTEELLWTNASPSSEFRSQTIFVPNISIYKWIVVVFRHSNAYDYKIAVKTNTTDVVASFPYGKYSDDIMEAVSRYAQIDMTNRTINFALGYRGEGASTNVCIPVAIYGSNI